MASFETLRNINGHMDAKPDDVVVLFEDEMSIDRAHNGGYGWTFSKRLTLRTPQRMYERRCVSDEMLYCTTESPV